MEGSNLLPEAKRTGVASVGRILREHPEIEAVLVGDGARGTLRSLSAARAGTVWTADRSKNFDFGTVYFTRKPRP